MIKRYIAGVVLCTISSLTSTEALSQSLVPGPQQLAKLNSLVDAFGKANDAETVELQNYSRDFGVPLRQQLANGQILELHRLEENVPWFYTTHNSDAAITTNTDDIWASPFNLTGNGYDGLGIWDGGGVRTTHQEFGGRVTQMDTVSGFNFHATHVAGTMVATGVDPEAKGMAFQANLDAYDWNNDDFEMGAAAANGLEISNHSYGFISGWFGSGGWYGTTSIDQDEDYKFGFYSSSTQNWDQIAFNAPNYLIVKSAGNDRNDDAPPAGTAHNHNGSGSFTDTHNDDGFDGGYDTVGTQGIAKNILTVGSALDVANYTSPSSVVINSFSGWGPADDGRIKPDLVANGNSLLSSLETSDSAYGRLSGTSMSSPNVSGSLALLQQYYQSNNGGSPMRASTLKALAIHTTEEAGLNDGPDYEFGWGLFNAERAAQKIQEDSSQNVIDEITLDDGEAYSRDVLIEAGDGPLKVTIVWTDPAGTPVAASLDPTNSMLVNNLDLRVSRNGTTHYPWSLNGADPTAAATRSSQNNVDNVEQVLIDFPIAGLYTITVDHQGALSGSQDFSIVVDGKDPVTTCNGLTITVDLNLGQQPSPGNDVILGTSGDDTISGLGGDDTICGMDGLDTIYGGPGADTIYGGDSLGNDTQRNDLFGGSGGDSLYGGPYDDSLFGQGGADFLQTNNSLSGLADQMFGGSGNDVMMSFSPAGSLMRGQGNSDEMHGSPAADDMRGEPGLDTMYGNGGDDQMTGGLGADIMYGGDDDDTMFGEGSRDDLFGDSGNDTLNGGVGNDDLDGGADTDICNGQGDEGIGSGDTAVNCETQTGIPRVAKQAQLNFRPGRLVLSDQQLQQIDQCDKTLDECLANPQGIRRDR